MPDARDVANAQLARLRLLDYAELVARLVDRGPEVSTSEGYNVEAQGLWDSGRSGGDLRVMVSVDDGGLRSSIAPVSADYIIRPDGTFA